MSRKEALSQFINQIHGRPVVVKLNSGVDYRGTFSMTFYTQFKCSYTLYMQTHFFSSAHRCFGVPRWLHEHCSRSNGRICERTTEE